MTSTLIKLHALAWAKTTAAWDDETRKGIEPSEALEQAAVEMIDAKMKPPPKPPNQLLPLLDELNKVIEDLAVPGPSVPRFRLRERGKVLTGALREMIEGLES
ncbi:MAG TPA: hypothetical protein VMX11_06970 [Actinomycetes bacterium]|nr:hypothetical protein [Actinomycetes bacterium]